MQCLTYMWRSNYSPPQWKLKFLDNVAQWVMVGSCCRIFAPSVIILARFLNPFVLSWKPDHVMVGATTLINEYWRWTWIRINCQCKHKILGLHHEILVHLWWAKDGLHHESRISASLTSSSLSAGKTSAPESGAQWFAGNMPEWGRRQCWQC